MSDQTSLRDYVELLRRYWRLIAGVTLAAAALAGLYSSQQQTVYITEASIALEDENRALGLIGTPVAPSSTAEERAALGAKTIVRRDVMDQVRTRLKLTLSTAELTRHIDVTPDVDSKLVIIKARAGSAAAAAALANTVAGVSVEKKTQEARTQFDAAARRLQERVRRAPRNDPSRVIFADRIAQLEALASVARPASIAAEATVPSSAVSPQPARNIVLGAILGLILGCGIAAARNALDRRLRDTDDVQHALGLPIVGNIPETVLGQVGFSVNGHKTPSGVELEAFRILRANLDYLDVEGSIRSLAVASALPKEGKSTVAASLASASAIAGRRTILVECDLRRPVLAARMGLDGEIGLIEHLVGTTPWQDVVHTIKTPVGEGLDCIFAGASADRPAELLVSPRFSNLLDELGEKYELIVLDTSPLLLVADTLGLLPQVDGVLLCTRASQTTKEQASAAMAVLSRLPSVPTGVVMTGVKNRDDGRYGYYSYERYGYS